MASASTAVRAAVNPNYRLQSAFRPQRLSFYAKIQLLPYLDTHHRRASFRRSQRNAAGLGLPSLLWRGGRGPKRRLQKLEPSRIKVEASVSHSSSTAEESSDDEKPPLWGLVLKGFLGGAQGKVGEKLMATLLKTTSAPIGSYVSEPITALHRLDPRVKQVRLISFPC